MKIKYTNQNLRVIYSCVIYLLVFSLVGCDAFVRKFTRKTTKEKDQEKEMVLTPEEYKGPQMTSQQRYHKYFLYWQSWQDELIDALYQKRSYKKKVDCIEQAVKNLRNLRPLLNARGLEILDSYIVKSNSFRDSIASDVYGKDDDRFYQYAINLKLDILHHLSYPKIENYLLSQSQ